MRTNWHYNMPQFCDVPTMGRFKWGSWTWDLCDNLELPLLGGSFQLSVAVSGPRSPDARDVASFQWLVAESAKIRPIVQTGVKGYLAEYEPSYWAEWVDYAGESEARRVLPELELSSDVWPLLRPHFIMIDSDAEMGWNIGIAYAASWDSEHGVEVKFSDGVLHSTTAEGVD